MCCPGLLMFLRDISIEDFFLQICRRSSYPKRLTLSSPAPSSSSLKQHSLLFSQSLIMNLGAFNVFENVWGRCLTFKGIKVI